MDRPITEHTPGAAPLSTAHTELLQRARVGRLATVDERGRPHNVPVCFALHAGAIYIAIDEKPKRRDPRELRRVRNIQANPAVCLVVDEYDDSDWSRLSWLQVRGSAALVDDEGERQDALAALRARYRQYREMALEERPLLRITPEWLVGWSASGG